MTIKCDIINALTTKIKQMEHSLSHQKHTTTDNMLAENTLIAIIFYMDYVPTMTSS